LLLFTGKVFADRSSKRFQRMARHRSSTPDCWESAWSILYDEETEEKSRAKIAVKLCTTFQYN